MSRLSLETSMPTQGLELTGEESVTGTLSCTCERFGRGEGSIGCSDARTRGRLEPCFVTADQSPDTIGCGPAAASA
jgi:hypothetical protein